MRCGACDCDNRDGEKFCRSCGFPLKDGGKADIPGGTICPRCRTANNPGSFFCYNCGKYFADSAAMTAAPAGSPKNAARPGRRTRKAPPKASLVMPGGNTIELGREPVFIERSDFSSTMPEELLMSISRQHILVTWEGGTFYVQDYGREGQGTKNHTGLNGTDIYQKGRQALKDGDRIEVARRLELTLDFRQP